LRKPSTIPTARVGHHVERALAERIAHAVHEARRRSGDRDALAPRHGAILVARSADEAMDLANRMAPEHLVLEHEALVAAAAHRGRRLMANTRPGGWVTTPRDRTMSWPTSRAARFRAGCRPPISSGYVGSARVAPRAGTAAIDGGLVGAGEGAYGARRIDRGAVDPHRGGRS